MNDEEPVEKVTIVVRKNGLVASIESIADGVEGLKKYALKAAKIWKSVITVAVALGVLDNTANHMRVTKWVLRDVIPRTVVADEPPERKHIQDTTYKLIVSMKPEVDSTADRTKLFKDILVSTPSGQQMLKEYKRVQRQRAEYGGVIAMNPRK